MGYNSVIFLCNDAVGQIDKDPEEWWKKTWHHLNESDCTRGWTSEYGFGSHANGYRAVWNSHADNTAIIIAGQNMALVAHQARRTNFHEPEGQVALLREWAASLGYDLHKSHNKTLIAQLQRAQREEAMTKAHPPSHSWEWQRRLKWLAALVKHLMFLAKP